MASNEKDGEICDTVLIITSLTSNITAGNKPNLYLTVQTTSAAYILTCNFKK
jgi:hypothetical protein